MVPPNGSRERGGPHRILPSPAARLQAVVQGDAEVAIAARRRPPPLGPAVAARLGGINAHAQIELGIAGTACRAGMASASASRRAAVRLSARRETGKEQSVRVRHDEGVATHIGPEPCAGIREGAGEASAGDQENKIRCHFDTNDSDLPQREVCCTNDCQFARS
jgi:hypothetical protein